MQTIKQWFEGCNEEWAKEALKITKYPNKEVSLLSQALLHAFNWNASNRKKKESWLTIYSIIKQKEIDEQNNKGMV
jgi:hypothetical protein